MGKKILLADDSITIQKVIELTFSDEDFEVVTVGNGRLAVERLEEVRPDIVLCDIIMPEKDGYEVCDYIKKHSGLGHVPVLLLTGAFEPFDQERAARVGCDGFLAKPFEPQSLISKVKDLLNQAASRPRPVSVPPPVTPISRPTPAPAISPAFADPTAVTMPSVSVPILQPAPAAYVPPEPDDEPLPLPATPEPGVFGEEAMPEPVVGTYSQPMELTPDPGTPPPPYAHTELSEDFGTEEPVVASPDELMPLMAEEAASLVTPPAAPEPEYEAPQAPDDGARTVIFKAGTTPPVWSQPTVEVPLETRAQATIAASAETTRPVFERVSLPPHVEEPAPQPEPEIEPEMEVESSFEPDFGEPATTPAPPEPATAFEPVPVPPPPPASAPPPPEAFAPAPPEPVAAFDAVPPPPLPEPEEVSFADIRPEPESQDLPPSHAAEVAVPMEQVAQIAQRVVAQISERVVREVAWEVIPDLAEMIIRKEIERLRAELEKV